jgi:predicted DsbA family dithiol-disulfide isomerase
MLIEVWSDLVCPWCYVNKVRLERVLAEFDTPLRPVVRWRAYRLTPGLPPEARAPLPRFMARRTGLDAASIAARMDMITALGEGAGLDFRLDQAVPVDTFDAHRLTTWADILGRRAELTGRLMRAYATEGGDLGDHDVLAALAEGCGLDRAEALAVLNGTDFAERVHAEEEHAAELGIGGVPFMVVGGRRQIHGAQSESTLRTQLSAALAQSA